MRKPIIDAYISYGAASWGMNKPFMLPNVKHPGFRKPFRIWVFKYFYKLDKTAPYTVKVRYDGTHGVYGAYRVRIFERSRINPFNLIYNKLKKAQYNPGFIIVSQQTLGKIEHLGQNGKLLPLETDGQSVKVYPTSQEMGERMEKFQGQN